MTPANLIQRQLDACNARDIDAFCACYAPDVQVFLLPDHTLRFRGIDAFRAAYSTQFADWPAQRARSESRQICGSFITDLEFVTGVPGRPDAHVLAIYNVVDNLITHAWFTPRT